MFKDTQMISVSVIMPVYNNAEFLSSAIESITQQTLKNFELLIMDDGSTDSSLEIANKAAEKDKRIKVFPRTNRKVASCLNELATLAKGEFIARMDGDDLAHPKRLEKQLAYLKLYSDTAVVGSWVQTFGKKQETWHFRKWDNYSRNLLFFGVTILCHPTWMLKKSLLLKYPYDDSFRFIIDREWLARVAINEPMLKFVALPEVLLDYRMHEASVSGQNEIQQRLKTNKVIKRYLSAYQVDLTDEEVELFTSISFAEVINPINLELAGKLIERIHLTISGVLNDDFKVFREKWLKFCVANDAFHLADKYMLDDKFVFFIEHKNRSSC
jgi:glycosyltransferase involved in cell wall biosynthesis